MTGRKYRDPRRRESRFPPCIDQIDVLWGWGKPGNDMPQQSTIIRQPYGPFLAVQLGTHRGYLGYMDVTHGWSLEQVQRVRNRHFSNYVFYPCLHA